MRTPATCPRCKRDLDRSALLRCKDMMCPVVAKEAPATSGKSAVMRVVIGGVGLAALIAMGWQATRPSHHGSGGWGGVSAPSAISSLGSIFARPAPTVVVPAPSTQGKDWSAASRVSSFSCEGRLAPGRATVCSTWELATADYNLSLVYRAAMARTKKPEALRRAQRDLLTRIDAAGTDSARIGGLYAASLDEIARY